MNRSILNLSLSRVLKLSLWGLLSLGFTPAQEVDSVAQANFPSALYTEIISYSAFVVDPFPRSKLTLVQPIDSISVPLGLLTFPYENRKTEVKLSWDWSTITITEWVEGAMIRMPFSASVEKGHRRRSGPVQYRTLELPPHGVIRIA